MTVTADFPPLVETFGDPTAGHVLAVLGGVHGDEPEGVLAAGIVARALEGATLYGAARVVRVANPAAFAVSERVAPDDDNLARVFPGKPDGSPAERIAHHLTRHVIAGADLLVDLHSAGRHYEMPVFAGFDAGARAGIAGPSRDAAFAFGTPIVWAHPSIASGRSISAAGSLGVPSIYVEGLGGGGVRRSDVDLYVTGVMRLLAQLDILPGEFPVIREPRVISEGSGDIDSGLECARDGFCMTRVSVGDDIDAGTSIADIVDDCGRTLETIVAQTAGTILMLRKTAAVKAGDRIAVMTDI